jgi:hypothetical protein
MKKVIRLTERDLTLLVKRIVRESEEMDEIRGRAPYGKAGGTDKFYDADDFEMEDETMMDYSEEETFGPDDYEKFRKFMIGCDTRWCTRTKEDFQKYANKGGFTIRK